MEEIILKIQTDTTYMLVAIVAVVVLLIIVLVIVVSAMRVKTYKDRWWNLRIDNKEKAEYLSVVEKELQEYKIRDASKTQELMQFGETKETLKHTNDSFTDLQSKYNELEKELSQLKAKLESAEGIYGNLMEEHQTLKERFDNVMEDNAKYRTNNARLLMKLESEERHSKMLKQREDSMDKKNG